MVIFISSLPNGYLNKNDLMLIAGAVKLENLVLVARRLQPRNEKNRADSNRRTMLFTSKLLRNSKSKWRWNGSVDCWWVQSIKVPLSLGKKGENLCDTSDPPMLLSRLLGIIYLSALVVQRNEQWWASLAEIMSRKK